MADTKGLTVPVKVHHEMPSIAADLGAQFEKFHEFEVREVEQGTTKAQFAVVPMGKSLVSLKPTLDEFRALPERRRGTSQMRDVNSFIDMVLRFKSGNTTIFANPDRAKPSLTAMFDYHPKGDDAKNADWLRHQSVYAPQLSDEWKAWGANNAKWMGQGDFALFIEERIPDLIVPNLDDPKLKTYATLVDGIWANPADMVKLSRGLQINVGSTVKNAQTLNSGEVSIVYETEHRDGAGQPLKIATLFTIAIQVFYAGTLYRIAARLRYRENQGVITWQYQLVRPDLVFDDAFNGPPAGEGDLSIVEKVKTETGVPVFLGSPEA